MDGIPVLGTVDDIAQISSRHRVRAVIIAGSAAGGATLQTIDSALPADVNVRVSPGLPNLGAARVILEPIDGMALFSLRRHRFSRRQRVAEASARSLRHVGRAGRRGDPDAGHRAGRSS